MAEGTALRIADNLHRCHIREVGIVYYELASEVDVTGNIMVWMDALLLPSFCMAHMSRRLLPSRHSYTCAGYGLRPIGRRPESLTSYRFETVDSLLSTDRATRIICVFSGPVQYSGKWNIHLLHNMRFPALLRSGV
jgi:hypothetical protein